MVITIEELRPMPLFAGLDEQQLGWVLAHAVENEFAVGERLFEQGQPADCFYVLLHGDVQVTKQVGEEQVVLANHVEPGTFTGEMPILLNQPYIATGTALQPTRMLTMSVADFRQMLSVCGPVAGVLLPVLARRVQAVDETVQQREKLAGLGKIAAGLAHELNNPAAAGRRAAEQMATALNSLQQAAIHLSGCDMTADRQQMMLDLQVSASQHLATATPLDTISQSDAEGEVGDWLTDHEVDNAWDVAPTFVNAGITTSQLEPLAEGVSQGAFCAAMTWLAASLEVATLLDIVQKTTERISDLVQAVKAYSYMDQAPVQQVDLHKGLDSTLTILGHKLKDVKVKREYDRSLPQICAHGSELNQVWTNIIDNAVDAMGGKGNITIRTLPDGPSCIRVEIEDSGPGIPADVQSNIFEPFFTTKDVGEGSGLGLSIVHRIVTQQHGGSLNFETAPGRTCFQIRLPVEQD